MYSDTVKASSALLHIGTSGWSYKHWSGVFYPGDLKPTQFLEYYTLHFDCVELNSSFYNLPLKTTVTGWMNRTPPHFRFCLKLSRYITHQLQLVNTELALQNFFDVFEGMIPRLGPILVQLPPGMVYDQSLATGFFDILKERYNQFNFAIEVRNTSWINDRFFDLLSGYGIGWVMADSGYRYPFYEAVTTDFVYLRLHGREQLYATDYPDADLRSFAEKIIGWLHAGKEVWVFFNNDFYGFAVKNAGRLTELVSELSNPVSE